MELDQVDRGILYSLQRDARRIPTHEIAERVGVSASTVRNRIERMESDGIIRGYHPEIDYDAAGLQLRVLFVCSAPGLERDGLAGEAREVGGVVAIREVLDGTENVQIEAVGTDTDDIARVNDELNELGLRVVNSKVLTNTHVQPFDHFGQQIVDESVADESPVD